MKKEKPASCQGYGTKAQGVCTSKSKRKIAKKVPEQKPYTMKIHESLERIRDGELSDMGLFELSIRALMPCDVFKEIRRRIELTRSLLEEGKPDAALVVIKSLLRNPQETRRGA